MLRELIDSNIINVSKKNYSKEQIKKVWQYLSSRDKSMVLHWIKIDLYHKDKKVFDWINSDLRKENEYSIIRNKENVATLNSLEKILEIHWIKEKYADILKKLENTRKKPIAIIQICLNLLWYKDHYWSEILVDWKFWQSSFYALTCFQFDSESYKEKWKVDFVVSGLTLVAIKKDIENKYPSVISLFEKDRLKVSEMIHTKEYDKKDEDIDNKLWKLDSQVTSQTSVESQDKSSWLEIKIPIDSLESLVDLILKNKLDNIDWKISNEIMNIISKKWKWYNQFWDCLLFDFEKKKKITSIDNSKYSQITRFMNRDIEYHDDFWDNIKKLKSDYDNYMNQLLTTINEEPINQDKLISIINQIKQLFISTKQILIDWIKSWIPEKDKDVFIVIKSFENAYDEHILWIENWDTNSIYSFFNDIFKNTDFIQNQIYSSFDLIDLDVEVYKNVLLTSTDEIQINNLVTSKKWLIFWKKFDIKQSNYWKKLIKYRDELPKEIDNDKKLQLLTVFMMGEMLSENKDVILTKLNDQEKKAFELYLESISDWNNIKHNWRIIALKFEILLSSILFTWIWVWWLLTRLWLTSWVRGFVWWVVAETAILTPTLTITWWLLDNKSKQQILSDLLDWDNYIKMLFFSSLSKALIWSLNNAILSWSSWVKVIWNTFVCKWFQLVLWTTVLTWANSIVFDWEFTYQELLNCLVIMTFFDVVWARIAKTNNWNISIDITWNKGLLTAEMSVLKRKIEQWLVSLFEWKWDLLQLKKDLTQLQKLKNDQNKWVLVTMKNNNWVYEKEWVIDPSKPKSLISPEYKSINISDIKDITRLRLWQILKDIDWKFAENLNSFKKLHDELKWYERDLIAWNKNTNLLQLAIDKTTQKINDKIQKLLPWFEAKFGQEMQVEFDSILKQPHINSLIQKWCVPDFMFKCNQQTFFVMKNINNDPNFVYIWTKTESWNFELLKINSDFVRNISLILSWK